MVDRMVLGRLVRRVLAACALCLAFIAPAGAEPGAFAGFVTYSPRDVVTSVSMAGENLGYLRETALLLAVGDSTLLRRIDSSHWAALSRLPSAWMLQIHDADEDYNCRALVDPKSGRLTIQHGVDRVGSSREADAARVATLALGYIERMRTEQGVFVGSGKDAGRVGGKAPESIAWKRLIDGNLRWSQGRALHPDQDSARLAETAKAQHPFAVIVTCSDSRLPPEILFDQGIGDLFVVRTAGEVVGALELGSIEYAVEHLGAGFILGGYCPGTSLVGAASGKVDALLFMAGLAIGTFTFSLTLPWVEEFQIRGSLGTLLLPQVLHVPQWAAAVGLAVLALGAFRLAGWVERKVAGNA
ncbi:MAG: DUF6691 family protein [Spirochaetota bacterium]